MKTNNIFLAGLLGLLIFTTSCEDNYLVIRGTGDIVTETLELDDFTGINMQGAEDVEISWGEEQEVSVVGHANIIDRIRTNVIGGTWQMELERGTYGHYDLKYYITLPRINKISNDGAARVLVNDFINEGDLTISIDGAGDIDLGRMQNTEELHISIDGVGHVKLHDEFPSLQLLDIWITGTGEFSGFPALTKECMIEIDGAAKCEVNVEDRLDIIIDGAGTVHYKGQPEISQDVSGIASVRNKND